MTKSQEDLIDYVFSEDTLRKAAEGSMEKRAAREVRIPPIVWPRGRLVAVDLATAHGDKSVIMDVRKSKNNQISVVYMDEWANFPEYKWYRNPIKLWKWHRLTSKWKKDSKYFEFRRTPPSKNRFKDMVEGRWKN